MGNGRIYNLKSIILLFIFINSIILSSQKNHKNGKGIKLKRKKKYLTGESPSQLIILPPSSVSRKNLNYSLYYSPNNKEFSQMPIRYKHGISIIITAYKTEKYIKSTLDSISEQTWFKNHNNWEILVGVDGCNETLKYVHSIMKNYKNLRVFMMEENRGTYITTNTIMSIAKYDFLLRFDADDVMFSYLVEFLINESEFYDYDRILFKAKNFGKDSETILWAEGQIFMKHWVFDYFGGFMPWRCSADSEFIIRVDQFINVKKIDIILFKRRIHDSNLTVQKKTKYKSKFRNLHFRYINKISKNINNINDAVIIKVINNYYEIFPNSTI